MGSNTTKADTHHDEDAYAESSKPHELGIADDYVPDSLEERKLVRTSISACFLRYGECTCCHTWTVQSMSNKQCRKNTQAVESQGLTICAPYSIGNAKTAGMTDDLDMDSTKYSVSLTVFFVGYVVFEVPSNMILARTKPSVFLPTIMFLWGCVTIAMAWVPNYKALIGLRIVVCVLEAGFAPGVLLTLSS